jgi:hypothetical protein
MENTTTTAGNVGGSNCTYCGGCHEGICPRVETVEFYENGSVKSVQLRELQTPVVLPDGEEMHIR